MKSILEELHYGNIRPFAERRLENTDEHKLYMEEFRVKFLDTLTENQKECFGAYEAHMSEIASKVECDAFVKGFRLGMKILMEGIEEEKTG